MILTVITIIVIVTTVQRSYFLTLINARDNSILLRYPVNYYDMFAISYVHSVNKSIVLELFDIRQNQIILTALEFETFGAGMPTELEPGQTLTHLPGGGMRIDGFDRYINNLQILVGYNTSHTLHLGKKSIPLDTLVDPGQPVQFTIRHFFTIRF